VRDQYVMQVADRCRLEPARVRERLEQARARLSAAPPAAGPGKSSRRTARPETRTSPTSDANDGDPGPIDRGEGSDDDGRDSSAADFGWRDGDDHDDGEPAARRPLSTSPSSRPELEALRWAVHRPEAVADRLEEILFADDRNRRAFEALAGADSNAQAIEDAPPDVADLLRRILVEEPPIVDDRVTDPVDAVVYNLLRESARRALLDLQALARSGSGDLAAPGADVGRIRLWLEQLDDPATGREAAERLLAWLVLKGQQTP